MGGALAIVLGIYERRQGEIAWRSYCYLIFVLFVSIAVFLAWRTDHHARLNATAWIKRPRLEPGLVIDDIDGDRFWYHFDITNQGGLSAQDIVYQTEFGGFIDAQFKAPAVRMLAPAGTFSVAPTNPAALTLPSASLLLFSLTLLYEATVDDAPRRFLSSYRFEVSHRLVRTGVAFHYASANESEGETVESGFLEQAHAAVAKALEGPTGTVFLVVHENTVTGAPNDVVVYTGRKTFSLMPQLLLATFLLTTESGRHIELARPVPQTGGAHVVTLEWDTDAGLLGVDGNHVADPPTFGNH